MDKISFRINGTEHSVGCEVSSTTTLLEYLRRTLNLRGTKYMCLEGGCGACIVSAVKCQGDAPQGVNSCLVSITSCQDWDIKTIEGIGNRLEGYHPLQTTLAETNGSQCGYCSPGMVVQMYSLLKSRKLTMLEIEKSLASNLCRCTGYRPILDAFKKFACDAPDPIDIEDLQICKKSGAKCVKSTSDERDWCFVSKNDLINKTVQIKLRDNRDWYKVYTLSDIFAIWQGIKTNSYMLVAGNTGKGVYPILEYPSVLIDISAIPDLKNYYIDQNLVIGAGNTLTELLKIFSTVANNDYFGYLKVLYDHLSLVAHDTVRNLGTIGGNLTLKNRHPEFKSDIFLLLETVGAQITIMLAPGVYKKVDTKAFLKEIMTKKIILNIILPPLSDEHKLVTYKIMPRAQNAHALIQAGFLYKITTNNKVVDCRIAYGGLSRTFTRASRTEQYLIGKKLFTNETLQGALYVLSQEMVVIENLLDPSVQYRRITALGLFYKGLLSLCPPHIMHPRYISGSVKLNETRPVSSGSQIFDTDTSLWPLNQPTPKLDALVQCAGETRYTEDVPTLPKEVFAAFVLSTVPLGTITTIDASKALQEPGVVAFYTASDIPGVNSFTAAVSTYSQANEEVLCSGKVQYYNQPLGIIVAESQSIAEKAATLVQVTYQNIQKPIIDVKVSKTDPTKVSLYKSVDATRTGSDIAKVIKGESNIYGQYHFTMETLVCVSHPTEEGLKVYAASQWIDTVQRMIHRALNIDQSRIDVVVRRLGGGYGLKATRSTQVCVACTLVTYKLNRPCRFIQSLSTNMRAVGKRPPCSTNFEIAVNKTGVIQYANYELYSDVGYIIDEPVLSLGVGIYNNCYQPDSWNYKSYQVITDTPSNTWCRCPSTLEHVAAAETVLEMISYKLNLDPINVRLANLDNDNHSDIREMTATLLANSQYIERKAEIEKFNSENRWKKRGLRASFLRWVPAGTMYYNINMSVYSDDGTVAIVHSGVEMGQGVNTKAIQICAYFLKIPVDKIQIKPNDTMTAPNGSISAASVTSQYVGVGVQRCCEKLLKRLEPVRDQLENPTWEDLITKAYELEVDLQVHCLVNSNDDQSYNIYGVAVAEVEVDGITGEWQFLRIDLLEDTGRSVNPEIDVGQVEGAFIMGVGYWTCENLIYDPNNGELLTNRTWEYWLPQARDIPQDFRVYFRKRSFSNAAILGAKDGAFTVDRIGASCLVHPKDFKFY